MHATLTSISLAAYLAAVVALPYGVMLLVDRLRGRRTWKPYSAVEGKLL